jgi:hypothetical protein
VAGLVEDPVLAQAMPSSSSSSAQQARQALADQLRDIRLAAGLSGRELAARAGWHGGSKVTDRARDQVAVRRRPPNLVPGVRGAA